MGLFNFAKKVLNENAERIQEYKMKYDRMDDELLLHIYRTRQLSVQQRMAITQLLHERGYGREDTE